MGSSRRLRQMLSSTRFPAMRPRRRARRRDAQRLRRIAVARPVLEEISQWLAAHRKLVLILLLALSVLIRAGYYFEAADGPLLYGHLWSEADMGFFDHWAKVILHDDPLGRQPLHPFFFWQVAPAEAHFRAHPEQIAQYEAAGVPHGDTDALYRALWDRWTHGKEYYQEPLYAYLIAFTYWLSGPSVRAVFAWQMMLGVATNLLVYLIARRYFGELAAALSGLLILFYSPLFIYELTLLRTTLTAFLAAAAVVALEWALSGDSWRRWWVTGAAVGIAMACQSTFSFFLAGCLGLLFLRSGSSPRAVLRPAAAIVCGAALAVSPIVARNIAVGVPPLGWTGAGVWTFVRFNTPSEDPRMGGVLPSFPDHIRVLGASDAKAIPAVLATLREHTPATLARLVLLKFQKTWNWYEEGDNVSFYFSRLYSSVLRYAPVTNTLVSPLLLVGLALFIKQWKRLAPLYLLAANGILVLMVTFPMGRYRAAYFAVLIPLGAAVVVQALEWISSRQFRKLLVLASALLVAFLWTSLPLPPSHPLIPSAYYFAPFSYYWRPPHDAAVEKQDWREAARILEQFLRSEPQDFATVDDPELIRFFAASHATLGGELQKAGEPARASLEFARANELGALLPK
jgi:4-amino-4-deoxy-L-arabinose transferase-like glycosyltransferase